MWTPLEECSLWLLSTLNDTPILASNFVLLRMFILLCNSDIFKLSYNMQNNSIIGGFHCHRCVFPVDDAQYELRQSMNGQVVQSFTDMMKDSVTQLWGFLIKKMISQNLLIIPNYIFNESMKHFQQNSNFNTFDTKIKCVHPLSSP